MSIVFKKTKVLTDVPFSYCPGCTHGIIHRLIAEVMEEMELDGDAIGVAPVGCSVTAYNFFSCDMVQAPHGRAPAVATGLKRVLPDKTVFTYQGDGDLAAIGTAETVHSGARGENICIFFVNNAIYGMTGGQMAPTSLPGQVTQTTPYGRDVPYSGNPIKVCEMMATIDGTAYIERVSVDSVKNIRKAKEAVRKAFLMQQQKRGLSLVEFLSTCPTNWGKSPVDALGWLKENMMPHYPLGVYKDVTEGKMRQNIIISGFGGQGILFTGKLLAYTGMLAGMNVSWLPSYGPEMRGGTANCTVCLNDQPVASPLVTAPDTIIVMNKPSYDKFSCTVKKGGKIFLDSSLISEYSEIEGVDTYAVDATRISRAQGYTGIANMIMLGKVLKETKIFDLQQIEAGLLKSVPARNKHLIPKNLEAIELGMRE